MTCEHNTISINKALFLLTIKDNTISKCAELQEFATTLRCGGQPGKTGCEVYRPQQH
jgi:hypothetical protein